MKNLILFALMAIPFMAQAQPAAVSSINDTSGINKFLFINRIERMSLSIRRDSVDMAIAGKIMDTVRLLNSPLALQIQSKADTSMLHMAVDLLEAEINKRQIAGNYLTTEADGSVTNELQTISGSGNTITLSNGGGSYTVPSVVGKVNYTDTSAMLQPYLLKSTASSTYQAAGSYATTSALSLKLNASDTAGKWLSSSTNIPTVSDRVKYTDTSTMLAPYLKSSTASSTFQPLGSYASTSSVAAKLNIADTTNKWKPQNYTPTLSEIVASLGYTPLKPTDTTGKWITQASADLRYLQNAPVTSVNSLTGAVALNTSNVPEVTNLYYTNARVLASSLTGLTTGSNATITASNTVLTGLQNVQAQINAINSNMVVNSTTVGLSKATLNATYPTSSFGFMVFCPSITLGGAIYIRVTTGASGTWQAISAPPAL